MNYTDFVVKVAEASGETKAVAGRAVDAVVQTIVDTLKAGEEVRVTGLGIFDVSAREARPGRNPRTGESMEIPAGKTLRFRAGKAAKDELNGAAKEQKNVAA
jgi:DNA-binding protein HU-beta